MTEGISAATAVHEIRAARADDGVTVTMATVTMATPGGKVDIEGEESEGGVLPRAVSGYLANGSVGPGKTEL